MEYFQNNGDEDCRKENRRWCFTHPSGLIKALEQILERNPPDRWGRREWRWDEKKLFGIYENTVIRISEGEPSKRQPEQLYYKPKEFDGRYRSSYSLDFYRDRLIENRFEFLSMPDDLMLFDADTIKKGTTMIRGETPEKLIQSCKSAFVFPEKHKHNSKAFREKIITENKLEVIKVIKEKDIPVEKGYVVMWHDPGRLLEDGDEEWSVMIRDTFDDVVTTVHNQMKYYGLIYDFDTEKQFLKKLKSGEHVILYKTQKRSDWTRVDQCKNCASKSQVYVAEVDLNRLNFWYYRMRYNKCRYYNHLSLVYEIDELLQKRHGQEDVKCYIPYSHNVMSGY
jgi:hypothetical protein